MTDWRSLRGSNFLAPEHLEAGPALVTIVKVHGETMLDEDDKTHNEVMLDIKAEQRSPDTGEIVALTQTEWKANVVNCHLLEALFCTPHYEQWAGREMVLGRVPCEVPGKYFGQPAVRVIGGPDLAHKITVSIVLKMKGGKKRKPINRELKPVRTPANVDPVTGEVGDAEAEEAAGNTQRPPDEAFGFGDEAPYPSENDTEAPSSDSGAESDAGAADGTIPGRGAKSAQGELA